MTISCVCILNSIICAYSIWFSIRNVIVNTIILGTLGYSNIFWINEISTWLTINVIFMIAVMVLLGVSATAICIYNFKQQSSKVVSSSHIWFSGIIIFIICQLGFAIWGLKVLLKHLIEWNTITVMGVCLLAIILIELIVCCVILVINVKLELTDHFKN